MQNNPADQIPDHHATAESYGLHLFGEETGEIMQLIGQLILTFGIALQWTGKGGRFGLDTPGVKDQITGAVDMTVTPRNRLAVELGDAKAAIDYMIARKIVDGDVVEMARLKKITKLLNPDAKDNLGRRLAP